jgi:hypothetical protein
MPYMLKEVEEDDDHDEEDDDVGEGIICPQPGTSFLIFCGAVAT